MATDTFSLYFSTRPSGSTPVGAADTIMLDQGGSVVTIPALALSTPIVTPIDASSGPKTQLLPASGIITYIKDDASANVITLAVSVLGQTIQRGAGATLEVQDESITLLLIGTNWYRL